MGNLKVKTLIFWACWIDPFGFFSLFVLVLFVVPLCFGLTHGRGWHWPRVGVGYQKIKPQAPSAELRYYIGTWFLICFFGRGVHGVEPATPEVARCFSHPVGRIMCQHRIRERFRLPEETSWAHREIPVIWKICKTNISKHVFEHNNSFELFFAPSAARHLALSRDKQSTLT